MILKKKYKYYRSITPLSDKWVEFKMGRPKRTLKRSVKLEDPGSAAEAKKVRKIGKSNF